MFYQRYHFHVSLALGLGCAPVNNCLLSALRDTTLTFHSLGLRCDLKWLFLAYRLTLAAFSASSWRWLSLFVNAFSSLQNIIGGRASSSRAPRRSSGKTMDLTAPSLSFRNHAVHHIRTMRCDMPPPTRPTAVVDDFIPADIVLGAVRTSMYSLSSCSR